MIRQIIVLLFYISMKILYVLFIIGIFYVLVKFIDLLTYTRTKRRYNLGYFTSRQSRTDNMYEEYYRSTYYLSTHLSFDAVIHDKGRYGEYMIFKDLQTYENYGARFLFNCYIPTQYNQTTEIDVIMLTLNGIFVFESKNYRGWVYGHEKQKQWTLTIPAGNRIQKEHFYNPIMQNKSHINALKFIIGNNIPIYSIIVFSNNCRLKIIRASDPMTDILSFGYLKPIIHYFSKQKPNSLTQETLISIYNKLYPYTQVSEEVKRRHVEDIQTKKMRT